MGLKTEQHIKTMMPPSPITAKYLEEMAAKKQPCPHVMIGTLGFLRSWSTSRSHVPTAATAAPSTTALVMAATVAATVVPATPSSPAAATTSS